MPLDSELKNYLRLVETETDETGAVVLFTEGNRFWDDLSEAAHFYIPKFPDLNQVIRPPSFRALEAARQLVKEDPVTLDWKESLPSPHWDHPVSERQLRLLETSGGPVLLQKALLALAIYFAYDDLQRQRRARPAIAKDAFKIVAAVWRLEGFGEEELARIQGPVFAEIVRQGIEQIGMIADLTPHGLKRAADVTMSVRSTIVELSKGYHAHYRMVAMMKHEMAKVGIDTRIVRAQRGGRGGKGNVKGVCSSLIVPA